MRSGRTSGVRHPGHLRTIGVGTKQTTQDRECTYQMHAGDDTCCRGGGGCRRNMLTPISPFTQAGLSTPLVTIQQSSGLWKQMNLTGRE